MIPPRTLLEKAHDRRHISYALSLVLGESDLTVDLTKKEVTRDHKWHQKERGEESELRGLSQAS
jgi:hypothetical protein